MNKYTRNIIKLLLFSFTICFSQFGNVLGDTNNNYTIDVLDIILIVNIIIGIENDPTDAEIWASDLNIDNEINVQDIVIVIDIILYDYNNAGYVLLENQTEHSGVTIFIPEIGIWQSIDSLGYFNLHFVPDGIWILKVRYPYFIDIETTIVSDDGHIFFDLNFLLIQQLKFWVVPTEITLDSGIESWEDLGITGYVTNISSSTASMSVSNGLPHFFYINPIDHEWNHEYELGGMDHFCFLNYQCFSSDGFPSQISYIINPGDTLSTDYLYIAGPFIDENCIVPGSYEGNFLISDDYNYPEYFGLWYFGEFIPGELFENINPLNRSLTKKDSLTFPVNINYGDE